MNEPTPPSRPASMQEKIARLRATFLEQLPRRLQQARTLLERLRADPADAAAAVDLHRFMHSIKGTGRSFGLQELGAAASLGEDLAAAQTEPPGGAVTPQWLAAMAGHLDAVAAQAAAAADATQAEPRARAADATPGYTLPEPAPAQAAGHLVYICDDETLTLEQLSSQLACFGYQTVGFTEPDALRAAVLARRPDGVIMDINFPQGHSAGTEVLAALRRDTGIALPTVFLSARNDFAARLAAVQAGGDAYFHKPARPMDLVARLDELTRQQQPEPYRILVVDDESEIASYHSLILQQAGMVTHQVAEPADVLDALRDFRPDMVLMDMYMPACSGRDLARVIRQQNDYVGLPIVYLSSETDREKQFSAMRVGAEGFLTKPVIPADLVAAVGIRAERMRALRGLMARDSLTGLFNHTTTTQLLENALATAQRTHGTLCFVMIDIDRFKSVNDTYGHPVGDQVLLALSRVLQQRLRNSDIVGRYGGEEFAVVLQDAQIERAAQLIDELRQDFARIVFHSPRGEFTCTFSAGIACHARHRRVELLREAADRALYEAKRGGRNRVVID